MAGDILSDVLDLVHLSGAVIFRIDVQGPWAIAANPGFEKFSSVLPRGTNHVIAFHIIVSGECWMHHQRAGWFKAGAGDAVVLPHGGVHQLGDQPGREAVPFQSILGERKLIDLRHARFETGAAPEVGILCGFLGCDRRAFEPLFASLPGLFRVQLGAQPGSLVGNAAQQVMDDTPGAQSVRTRLTEVLFLQTLRQYVEVLPPDARGWLAAVRDPVVGRALHAMHEEPCRDWSVQTLAQCAASSRSRLATRFRDVLGEPPMHYLTQLRMQMAARLLRERSCPVTAIADEVGYDSVAAFQRAFKRCHGMPPAQWRRAATQHA